MASDLESQMVSVERVAAYTAMEQERPHRLPGDPNNNSTSSSALEQVMNEWINGIGVGVMNEWMG